MLGCLRPRVVGGSTMILNHSKDHPCGSPLCSVTVHAASQRMLLSPVVHHFTRPSGRCQQLESPELLLCPELLTLPQTS